MNQGAEPADHAIGRSRCGLSTKIHHAVDGKGRPLVVLVGPSQGRDAPLCLPVLDSIRVLRPGAARPRTRPDSVLADRAYSSRVIRAECAAVGSSRSSPNHETSKATASGAVHGAVDL
ncbi:hypothetical protein ACVW07_002234 [Cellulomonas sp. URHB0016]